MSQQSRSPYLYDPNRLADVIAAIQATAIYKFYKLSFAGWADRISGDKELSEHWKCVFEQHPEFFRLDSAREKASLVWRRQHQKRFSVDEAQTITKEEFYELDDHQKKRVSRTPLGATEIETLIETAINLHSRAMEHKRESRWWITAVVGTVGAVSGFLGALIGALLGG